MTQQDTSDNFPLEEDAFVAAVKAAREEYALWDNEDPKLWPLVINTAIQAYQRHLNPAPDPSLIEKLEASPEIHGDCKRAAVAIVRQHQAEQPQDVVERVAEAIEGVYLFSRYNDWTRDRVKGFPVEICRYGDEGEGKIVVVARFAGGQENEGPSLKQCVQRERAKAAIAAMGDGSATIAPVVPKADSVPSPASDQFAEVSKMVPSKMPVVNEAQVARWLDSVFLDLGCLNREQRSTHAESAIATIKDLAIKGGWGLKWK